MNAHSGWLSIGRLIVAATIAIVAACGGDRDAPVPAASTPSASTTPAVSAAGTGTDSGKAAYAACHSCHGIDGGGSRALNAPSLLNQSSWYLKRQLQNFKRGIRGSAKGDIYGMQMVPFANTLMDDAAIDAVLAYIDSLPDRVPAATVEGDIQRGADFYSNVCGACHGPAAEGNEGLQAPALAGVDDWYLLRQLKNFETGKRGASKDDKYGYQMALMMKALPDDETARDVVAYIQSLAQ